MAARPGVGQRCGPVAGPFCVCFAAATRPRSGREAGANAPAYLEKHKNPVCIEGPRVGRPCARRIKCANQVVFGWEKLCGEVRKHALRGRRAPRQPLPRPPRAAIPPKNGVLRFVVWVFGPRPQLLPGPTPNSKTVQKLNYHGWDCPESGHSPRCRRNSRKTWRHAREVARARRAAPPRRPRQRAAPPDLARGTLGQAQAAPTATVAGGRCPGADAAPCQPARRLLPRLALDGPVRRPRPTDPARCLRVRAPTPRGAPGAACTPCGRGAGRSPGPAPVGGARGRCAGALRPRARCAGARRPRALAAAKRPRPLRGRRAAAQRPRARGRGGPRALPARAAAANADAICTRFGASAWCQPGA